MRVSFVCQLAHQPRTRHLPVAHHGLRRYLEYLCSFFDTQSAEKLQRKDADAAYISDGIAGSINNSLTKLSGFKVVPNSVTAQYRGKAAEFQKIGKTLGVDTILSGRVVQRANNCVSVSSLTPSEGECFPRNLRRAKLLP